MAKYLPPEGYTFDESSGKYYSSAIGTDPETGSPVQWVTWFDAESGEYIQQSYPIAPPPPPKAFVQEPLPAPPPPPPPPPQSPETPPSYQRTQPRSRKQPGEKNPNKKLIAIIATVAIVISGAILGFYILLSSDEAHGDITITVLTGWEDFFAGSNLQNDFSSVAIDTECDRDGNYVVNVTLESRNTVTFSLYGEVNHSSPYGAVTPLARGAFINNHTMQAGSTETFSFAVQPEFSIDDGELNVQVWIAATQDAGAAVTPTPEQTHEPELPDDAFEPSIHETKVGGW